MGTQVHLGTSVLSRGSIIFSQTTTNCLNIILWRHFDHLWLPYCRLDSPWTFSVSSTLSFNTSISFLSVSSFVFTSVPVQWDIPSGKLQHIQSQLSNEHFHAPSIWMIGEVLIADLPYRCSVLSSCFCRDTFSSKTTLNCSRRLNYDIHGRSLIKTVLR